MSVTATRHHGHSHSTSESSGNVMGYDLPLIPEFLGKEKEVVSNSLDPSQIEYFHGKHIPRNVFVAVKNASDELPGPVSDCLKRNSGWKVNVCDNECKDKFMAETFAGTRVAWAYNLIHPMLGAAKADIWRYATLYTYGGVYIDDDSDVRTLFDDIISPEDTLVASEEGASSYGECFTTAYHLNEENLKKTYGHNYTQAKFFHEVDAQTGNLMFFHGHTILNWLLFVAPRHPLMYELLNHVTEVVKSEYIRKSYLHVTRWDVKWKHFFCTTTFMLTYTAREMVLMNDTRFYSHPEGVYYTDSTNRISYRIPLQNLPSDFSKLMSSAVYMPRIEVNNFAIYKGRVKAISTGKDPNHYTRLLQKKNPPLLSEYAELNNVDNWVNFLTGETVMGEVGRDVYYVTNHTRRPFPNFETFVKMNFTIQKIRHLKEHMLQAIPLGPPLPSLMPPDPASTPVAAPQTSSESATKSATDPNATPSPSALPTPPPTIAPTAVPTRTPTLPFLSSDTTTQQGAQVTLDPLVKKGVLSSDVVQSATLSKLSRVQTRFQSIPIQCFGDDYAGTRDDVINERWKDILYGTDENSLKMSATEETYYIYPFCMRTYQLGNTLGYYLNDVSCAVSSGTHFVAVYKEATILDKTALIFNQASYNQSSPESAMYSFFMGLPDLIPATKPLPLTQAKDAIKSNCNCLQFCWENEHAPWLKNIPMISTIVKGAIEKYLTASGVRIDKDNLHVNSDNDAIYLPNPKYINAVADLAKVSTKGESTINSRNNDVLTRLNNMYRILKAGSHAYAPLVMDGLSSGLVASLWDNEDVVNRAMLKQTIDTARSKSSHESIAHFIKVNHFQSHSDAHRNELLLPFLPDVVIQYRCGDNIGFGRTRYGLLPFRTFVDRIFTAFGGNSQQSVINETWVETVEVTENLDGIENKTYTNLSHTVKFKRRLLAPFFLYIIADSPNRAAGHPYSHRCETILDKLSQYLIRYFPLATIVVLRGHDVFLDYARLAFTPRLVFCSASTFCLWPSLVHPDVGQSIKSNPRTVYYPITPLIAGSGNKVQFHPGFNWIDDIEMIKDFRRFRPWTHLLDVLEEE